MPSSSTARKDAVTEARTGKPGEVPRQRGGQAQAERPTTADGRGGLSMPSLSIPRIRLPAGRAGNVVWWGGLAVVAAFGVIDWPVAALIAAGTWVAEQHAKESSRASEAG
jgi:hypothetical protein